MEDSTVDIKKTIHFFDRDNRITKKINELYRTKYRILRKEQYYSLIIIEGLKALKSKDFKLLSISDLMQILETAE